MSRYGSFFLPVLLTVVAGAKAGPQDELVHNRFHESAWTSEQRQVWQTIETWNRAFANNDPDTYFEFIADDITVITPSNPYRVEGKPDDREEFEFGIHRTYSKVGLFQEMLPDVRVYGDTAVVTYFSRGYYGGDDSAAMGYLKETDVLHRIDGKWKIVHIHVSK